VDRALLQQQGGQEVQPGLAAVVEHDGALSLAALHQPGRGEALDGLAHRPSVDAQRLGQLALGRQRPPLREGPRHDGGGELPLDGVRDGDVGNRVQIHLDLHRQPIRSKVEW